MRNTTLLTAIALISITGWAISADAQGTEDWTFYGGFQVGFRAVDVEGSESKYRQHLNLEDGPRLFNLNFELTPSEEMRSLFDRVELDMTNLGGDPFETIRSAKGRLVGPRASPALRHLRTTGGLGAGDRLRRPGAED